MVLDTQAVDVENGGVLQDVDVGADIAQHEFDIQSASLTLAVLDGGGAALETAFEAQCGAVANAGDG